jgi:hypothetical protein
MTFAKGSICLLVIVLLCLTWKSGAHNLYAGLLFTKPVSHAQVDVSRTAPPAKLDWASPRAWSGVMSDPTYLVSQLDVRHPAGKFRFRDVRCHALIEPFEEHVKTLTVIRAAATVEEAATFARDAMRQVRGLTDNYDRSLAAFEIAGKENPPFRNPDRFSWGVNFKDVWVQVNRPKNGRTWYVVLTFHRPLW